MPIQEGQLMSETGATKFFDLYSVGKALAEEIDDYIDTWHDGKGFGSSLHEYLGLTKEEYAAWVKDAYCLPVILDARLSHRLLKESIDEYQCRLQIAARAGDARALEQLKKWLKKA
jgi:hypothetical protein